jgi:ClpX C4-type zinc finger
MQREDPDGIVLVCDFCRRDWDGQEPMIEGHHGSILCLECLKVALRDQAAGGGKYKCTLCLRFNMPPELPHWANPGHLEAIVCQECLYQAARAFSRNPDIPWKFDAAQFPAPVKPLAKSADLS